MYMEISKKTVPENYRNRYIILLINKQGNDGLSNELLDARELLRPIARGFERYMYVNLRATVTSGYRANNPTRTLYDYVAFWSRSDNASPLPVPIEFKRVNVAIILEAQRAVIRSRAISSNGQEKWNELKLPRVHARAIE